MKGYKGFDKNFRCRGFQFKVGETYKIDGEIKICERGFHFCDEPLAVFEYYNPANSRFALVEATGDIVADGKHKFCTNELVIIKELTLNELIKSATSLKTATNTGNCSAATNTGDYSAATNTGDYSAATNTGNCSAATNTGDYSAATNTGNRSAATNTGNYSAATNTGNCSVTTNTGNWSAAIVAGKNSVAVVTGYQSRAKGALGCWLVLGEWTKNELSDVQAFKVDGKKIKSDTFYRLKGGQAVEAEEES